MTQFKAMLPNPAQLFGNTWKFYTTHFNKLIAIVSVAVVFSIILNLVVAFMLALGMNQDPEQGALGAVSILVMILSLVSIIVAIWSQTALLCFLRDTTISFKQAYGEASRLFGSYFWIVFLAGIITLVGFVLLIIPGIIVAIWFSFATYVFIMEGDRGWQALKKSKEYVRGRWWAIFSRFVFIAAIAIVLTIALDAAFQAIQFDIGSNLIHLFVGPFITSYVFLLYLALKDAIASDTQVAPQEVSSQASEDASEEA